MGSTQFIQKITSGSWSYVNMYHIDIRAYLKLHMTTFNNEISISYGIDNLEAVELKM